MANSNLCMNALQSRKSECLVSGKNGELFANYDCIVKLSNSDEMKASCDMAMLTSASSGHDFYRIDRESGDARLQNCQTKYQSCCVQNGQPNLFDQPEGYNLGKKPTCHVQSSVMGTFTMNKAFGDVVGETTHPGRHEPASFQTFDGGNDKFHYDGKIVNTRHNEGCFMGRNGVPIGNQCDVSKASSHCNQNLNLCTLDTVFVPLKSQRAPNRADVHVRVEDGVASKFKKQNNYLRQQFIERVAQVESESYNRFQSTIDNLSGDRFTVHDVKDGDVMHRHYFNEFLSAGPGVQKGLESYLTEKEKKIAASLDRSQKQSLKLYLNSSDDVRSRMRRGMDKDKLMLDAFNAVAKHSQSLQEMGVTASDALKMAREGRFNEAYLSQNESCRDDDARASDIASELANNSGMTPEEKQLRVRIAKENASNCKVRTSVAPRIMSELRGYMNFSEIEKAIQSRIKKDNQPYEMPKFLPVSSKSTYNQIESSEDFAQSNFDLAMSTGSVYRG